MRQIIVSGATGFAGRNLLRMCHDFGLKVLPVVRSKERAQSLGLDDFLGFSELSGELLTRRGIDDGYFIHLAGASRDDDQNSLWNSIVVTTESVVRAAKESGVKRILYLSGYGVTANSSNRYFRAKAKAEAIIKSSGIPYSIFRCSYLLGSGDELTPFLLENLRSGQIEIPGDGSYILQPVYIKDAVKILLNCALDDTNDNHLIDLLGEPISYFDLVKLIATKVAPETIIAKTPIEEFIRKACFSTDPDFTLEELGVLVCNKVGKPTKTCFGIKVRNVKEFMNELLDVNV